ncbi:hypothetical protein V1517DRAFT_332708 [Lipomyces orientalis]|uniref:Uncharacterized protein n=1 Tax=Lipomyces orientalis TaxID=1233043 RepID=A0ACC3TE32_9ASCO
MQWASDMYATPTSTPRSDDGSSAKLGEPSKRKRTARACDSCYRKKIQCDAAPKQCNWCKHHDLDCTFDRVIGGSRKKKKNGPLKDQRSSTRLAERIERIEELLSKTIANQKDATSGPIDNQSSQGSLSSSLSSNNPHPSAIGPCLGRLHFAGYNLGQISSLNGLPLLSPEGQEWVWTKTGQRGAFEKLCAFGPPWQRHRQFHTSPASSEIMRSHLSVDLPDRAAVEEYVSVYRASSIRAVFPIIDLVLFNETLRMAYESPPETIHPYGVVSAKATVLAFLSFVQIFNLDTQTPLQMDGEAYAAKSQSLAPQLVPELTLDCLQTNIMLCLYHLFSGDLQSAALLMSFSSRAVFMLGGHIRPDPKGAPTQRTATMSYETRMRLHVRNLFWLCYTLDTEIALRSGQPPSISNEHCDLTLPPHYKEILYEHSFHDDPVANDDLVVPLYPSDLQLSIIKSRAQSALYSVNTLHKSDAQLLRDIRELDDELERWRMSLPPHCRPTLAFSEDMPGNSNMSMQTIILRLAYHHTVAIIHRASGRCRAWADYKSGEMEGVSSSLALSVEASRSSLFYLRSAVHALASDCFWMILFYPMSALLTIFCNLLLDPLGPRAVQDLELLTSIPDMIRAIRIRQLTLNEILHIKLVDDVVAELTRLGRCAVVKARREGEGGALAA